MRARRGKCAARGVNVIGEKSTKGVFPKGVSDWGEAEQRKEGTRRLKSEKAQKTSQRRRSRDLKKVENQRRRNQKANHSKKVRPEEGERGKQKTGN